MNLKKSIEPDCPTSENEWCIDDVVDDLPQEQKNYVYVNL